MIIRKSAAEIDRIARAGTLVAETIPAGERIVPGITTLGSTGSPTSSSARTAVCPPRRATRAIRAPSASRPTTWSFTASSGRTVVEDGDLVTIDVGVTLGTAIADSAYTFGVGSIDAESQRLLDVCQDALVAGVAEARPSTSGSGTSRTRCRRSSRVQGSRWSRASSGTGSAGTTTRTPTCRTSGDPGRGPRLGGDDDRDRADDHDGLSRRSGSRRTGDLDHRRVASRPFRAHRRDPPRTARDPPRVGIATERARLLQQAARTAAGRSVPRSCGISMNIDGQARTLREESVGSQGREDRGRGRGGRGPAEHDVPRRARGRPVRARKDLGEDAQALHPDPSGVTGSRWKAVRTTSRAAASPSASSSRPLRSSR